ncbi:MAG: PfaD family polyunsaturated fatty acid/polyketide biosynthesis protein [Nannocystaceae bacterium]
MQADSSILGVWRTNGPDAVFEPAALNAAVARVRETAYIVRQSARGPVGVGFGGHVAADGSGLPHLGTLPGLYPEWLGDRSFLEVHGLRFPYVAGAMANGIHTVAMVEAMATAGMLGFFGAAGLELPRVTDAIAQLRSTLGTRHPWGSNLIHSPNEPALEQAVADLYVQQRVRRVSASAYMALTPAIVSYAFHGVRQGADGQLERDNHVFAKVSRPEVARRFLAPPPGPMLEALTQQGRLTPDEARLARRLPVAEDVIVESDSGGHTDNQPLTALFPISVQARDQPVAEHGYARPIRVGAAGGLGTPSAVAAAFGLGAAFVLTGSVNQAAVESGLSEPGRRMLATAELSDVIMAPAADMFELGVDVQVLKRGTMFGVRAKRLYELYRAHASLQAMPAAEVKRLESEILGRPWPAVWDECVGFFGQRDPPQLQRAAADPRHQMALVFRWYLGLSSRWAIAGEPSRRLDYQIWCGPAMGSFNSWVAGSFLEPPSSRSVVQIALNLLEGAAVVTRAHQLRSYGVPVPASAFHFVPRPLQ